MFTPHRTLLVIAALCTSVLAATLPASPAGAHGSLSDPASRTYHCRYKDNPENPANGGCKALKEAGGTQPIYDWNEVNLANAAGNHQALIPDGKLCSAGRAKYRGLDLVRTDWPATKVTAGNRNITFSATAPHVRGTFTIYMTKPGWTTKALAWGDLVQIAKFTSTPSFSWNVNFPSRTGRQILYTVWQRNDSPEAFYACSDVVY